MLIGKTIGNTVHVLTGPFCKLWEHRFSVPGLASIPPSLCITLDNPGLTGFFSVLKENELKEKKNSGIIKLLFDVSIIRAGISLIDITEKAAADWIGRIVYKVKCNELCLHTSGKASARGPRTEPGRGEGELVDLLSGWSSGWSWPSWRPNERGARLCWVFKNDAGNLVGYSDYKVIFCASLAFSCACFLVEWKLRISFSM